MEKLFFYDTETTGVDLAKHAIHQISGSIRIEGVIKEEFDIKIRPSEKTVIDPEALAISGLVPSDMHAPGRLPLFAAYTKIIQMMEKYVDRCNPTDKLHLVGFNNRGFDDNFFRKFFLENDDKYFGSWFWSDTQDALVYASRYLMHQRETMPKFRQMDVARILGIPVDESKLHDAKYDTEILIQIYDKVTKPYLIYD